MFDFHVYFPYMASLLIIDDQRDFADSLKKGLSELDYNVDTAYNGEEGKRLVLAKKYDVIIMDVIMPKVDGIHLCRLIRNEGITSPVLFISALDNVSDKISGLDAGGDDYLAKPFHFDELVARIKALSRRYSSETTTPSALRANGLFIDRVKMSAYREGKDLGLTKKEFRLLEYFIRNEGKVLSKAELAENVWDVDFDTGTNIVEVYVNYLRNKLDKGYDKKMIATKFGMGYVFNGE